MLSYNGWSVWVSVDGQELPQYLTTVKEESSGRLHTSSHKVSCWIASEEGKEFSIHVQPGFLVAPNKTYRTDVYTDGTYASGRLLGRNGPNQDKVDILGRDDLNTKTLAPFLFSRLTLTDDDSASRDVSHLKDLGIISVEVDQVLVIGLEHPSQSAPNLAKTVSEKDPIHETSKKAGAHCVSFGKHRPAVFSQVFSTQSLRGPFIIFEFRYRSADMLRAQGIMPLINNDRSEAKTAVSGCTIKQPPQNPISGPSSQQREMKRERDHKLDIDVDAEIKALRAKLHSLEKRRNKENLRQDTSRPKKKPKIEPLDHSNFDDEVIDLT